MPYGSLLTDTVQSSTAGTPPQFNDGNGTQVGTLCRAWVNYKGTSTQSIRASFNVSSVTYNSTGNYLVNFTNAFVDANYCAAVNCDYDGTAFPINAKTFTTTNCLVQTVLPNLSAYSDHSIVNLAIFR